MKNFLCVILCCVIAFSAMTVFADTDSRNLRDPFNNSLFEVVSEIKISKEQMAPFGTNGGMYFPRAFEYYIMTPGTEENLVNAVKLKIDYDGNVTSEVVDENITTKEMDEYFYPSESNSNEENTEVKFNDGLAVFSTYDEVDDMSFTSFKDINGKEFYSGADYFHSYDYNLGLLVDYEWVVDYSTDNNKEYTKFIKILTSKSEYEFEGFITTFNDDGYAIMDVNKSVGYSDDDKFYVVKLKEYPISTVSFNGEKILFDQIPVSENNRLLVPMRAIFEKIGATVEWNGETGSIIAQKDDVTIELRPGSTTAVKNGEEINLDVAAKAVNGRTLVPVRFVADCFGVEVEWIGERNHVKLTK